ncbi:MAG: alpha/beta fold hydrolase [Actinomycetota bacterium]
MEAASIAEPRPHPRVGNQLVRSWPATGTPARAEVILVHGLSEHTGRYERVGRLLAEAGMEVIGADLVGWGGTGGRRGHVRDWVAYLDQVEALMEDAAGRGAERVLLGHSMGGLIALEYALSQRPGPDLLVLSAPSLVGGSRGQRRLATILDPILPILSIPGGIEGDQLSRDPSVGEAYFRDPLVHTAATIRFGRQFFQAMDRTRSALPRLGVPTLVLHGGHDSLVPSTCTVDLGELPGVERRFYPHLRHELLNEPEGPEIVAEIIAWIDAHLSRGLSPRPPPGRDDRRREPGP